MSRPLAPSSFWYATDGEYKNEYPALNRDIAVDVLIIGAGITGLSTVNWLIV